MGRKITAKVCEVSLGGEEVMKCSKMDGEDYKVAI